MEKTRKTIKPIAFFFFIDSLLSIHFLQKKNWCENGKNWGKAFFILPTILYLEFVELTACKAANLSFVIMLFNVVFQYLLRQSLLDAKNHFWDLQFSISNFLLFFEWWKKNFPIFSIFTTIYALFSITLILFIYYIAFTRLPLILICDLYTLNH